MKIFTFSCFSTKCVVKIASDEIIASNLANECFNLCKNLHLKYNFFDKNSLISKINNRKNQKIKLDFQTQNILKEVLKLSKITNYAFDITKISLKTNEATPNLIGEEAIKIDKKYLYFENPKTKIDLGGVIKEYAVDECAKICEKYPFVINFGGDMKFNKNINIKLKNPKNPSEAIHEISLNNNSLTTSGLYERKNHIIKDEPFKYNQVSVYGENTLACGIFSTSLCFKNFELPKDYKAILIDFDNNIFYKN